MGECLMNKPTLEMLSKFVTINEQYARSTRIDEDNIDTTGFIYSESIDTFLNMLIGHQSRSQQGAYTWTGPYGSGKSTLALSLSTALRGDEHQRKKAVQLYNQNTAERLWLSFPPRTAGWKVVSIVGGHGELESLLCEQLASAGIIKEATKISSDNRQTFQKFLINSIELYISEHTNYGGIMIFVDEMGKLLEAASDGHGDVYFFQLLAEAASRSNGRFVFIGILHQSFQEYANSPIKRVRDEWGKIHGRFVDITINLNSSEQIELIASCLGQTCSSKTQKLLSRRTYELLSDAKKAPQENLPNLLESCWPINPITTLLIGPISKRSYGQNQRSIFNFLSSGEPLGLKYFLDRTEINSDALYDPADLWDYLNVNWSSSIAVSLDSHHFANTKEALSRLEMLSDAREEHARVLKSISIMDLMSQVTGISPSHIALQVALNLSPHKVTKITNFLIQHSLIIFKKYKNAYALFEGSDFDIETELANKLRVTNNPRISDISQYFMMPDVVAKRHYLQTGTMRWCEIKLCPPEDVHEVVQEFTPNASKFALLLLICTEDKLLFETICDKYNNHKHIIFGRNADLSEIHEPLIEYYALLDLLQNSNELLKDKVARRELRDRIASIHGLIENKINGAIENTFWGSEQSKSFSLSKIASDVADKIFFAAPIIHNELVNREKPSASANGAVRALLYNAVDNALLENLGIHKFPPERGLYDSIIKKNNLHMIEGKQYKFQSPITLPKNFDIAQFQPLWSATLDYLRINSARNVHLTELHKLWSQPPFGVKAGLFSIIATLFYITHRSQLAYYREDIFVTDFQDFDIDYIHKTPALVEFRWLDMDADTKKLLSTLASIPAEIDGNQITSIEPLEVARALIATFDKVEPWTLRTNKISLNAKRIRSLFKKASDPAKFTLNDIPSLVEGLSFNDDIKVKELSFKIKDGLVELRDFFGGQINRFRKHVLNELGVYAESKSSFNELKVRAEKLRGIAGQFKLDSFILQLSKIEDKTSDFEKLAGAILGKTAKAWIDMDFDRLLVETVLICREFRNLETLTSIKSVTSSSYSFALVDHNLHDSSSSKPTIFELTKSEIDDASKIMNSLKQKHKSKAEQRALLAALVLLSKEWAEQK